MAQYFNLLAAGIETPLPICDDHSLQCGECQIALLAGALGITTGSHDAAEPRVSQRGLQQGPAGDFLQHRPEFRFGSGVTRAKVVVKKPGAQLRRA